MPPRWTDSRVTAAVFGETLDELSQGLIEFAEHELSLLRPAGPRPKKGPDKRIRIRA